MELNKVFDYSYYKKLGFNNIGSWSEDDLSQFLFLDFLNASGNITMGKDMPESFTKSFKFFWERSKKQQNILRFMDWIFLKFISLFEKKNNNKKILFVTSNAPAVLGAKKQYSLKFICRGKRDRLFAIRHLMGYIDINDLVQHVFYYLKERKIEYLYLLIKSVEAKLKSIKPNYIVLSNDSLPIERAIILVSKKLGIKTIEIQHGIYVQPESFSAGEKAPTGPLGNGQAADYVLVWGKYFKDLYVQQKIRDPEDIYVLGYRYLIKRDRAVKKKNHHYTICYLAQDYEFYNRSFLETKLDTIKKLSETCKKLDLEFICRLHPGDDRELFTKKLPQVNFAPKKERIERTFKMADVLISFNSTALIEAAMRSKICLQLMNFPVGSDNFEKLGMCSKSFETIAELEDYLKEISDAPNLEKFRIKFNNNYIETRHNPGLRFLEILEEIRNKTT